MNTGLKRSGNECFYTRPEIAKLLIEKTNLLLPLKNFTQIIEPSAGNGSFSTLLKEYNSNVIAYDIDPKHPDIIKCDYLTTTIPNNNTLVIGNPPFGKNSSLAKKFIKHSAKFADIIAFILPRSFLKESMFNAFPLNFSCIYTEELPKSSFTIDSTNYDVPCIFVVYKKGETLRSVFNPIENGKYTFISKETVGNNIVSFKRVGFYAGLFSANLDVNVNSHYFIQFHEPVDIVKLNSIIFSDNNTVGAKSISKKELIQKLNEITETI